LALAAGQVSGVVESKDGRLLLVKGRTFKEKKETIETQVNKNNFLYQGWAGRLAYPMLLYLEPH
jgi:hypothetical protein